MREVVLSCFWQPGDDRFVPGDVVEVDDDVAAWLERSGSVVKPTRGAAVVAPAPAAVDSEPAPAPGEVEPDPEAKSVDDGRPARTASIDQWRDYAKNCGIDTKGLNKQEIISATKK
ncbi:hypothetical protein ACEN2D_02215 [Corynebacterium auriscanis]|uniref:hypothetical protein n=1 Tax=Corynebacterium auriscanis TaxID=99807 RepID=UPI003CF500E9